MSYNLRFPEGLFLVFSFHFFEFNKKAKTIQMFSEDLGVGILAGIDL